jgi:1-deoxy-D-xylulose-5-phosphate reductoisomerase
MNGFVGLLPSLSALKARNILALANKETLVSGGPLLARYIDRIIPVDSEHSGLWQILRHEPRENVKRLIVTASGGPFFGADIEKLISASLEQALKHPTWKMSEQITINSATLVNKALEVAEAHYLFRIPMDKIAVKVERTSRVHCLVEFIDGSTQIQLAYPDMRVPISVALGMGKRVDHIVEPMDLREFRTVAFNDVDDKLFPAIQLMRKCLSQGPLFGTVYNAANEVLVEKFIHNEIGFLDIVSGIDQVISKFSNTNARPTLAEVQAADQWGREQAGLIQLHLYDEMAAKNPIPAFGT